MNPFEIGSVVRRWGFYTNRRLAYAGVACVSHSRELRIRFIEAEHHAHTTTLPERMRLEQLIRESVGAEMAQTLGLATAPIFGFEPFKLSEPQLALSVFGTSQGEPLPGKPSC